MPSPRLSPAAEVVLRLLRRDGRADCASGVPEPAADVTVDRLRHDAFAAELLDEHAARDLALAKAGIFALRASRRGVLDA